MPDRPIIFSGPMVSALLDGRKTQTRRVLGNSGRRNGQSNIFNADIGWSDSFVMDPGNAGWRDRYTPYATGDRLYVREAWRSERGLDRQNASEIEAACLDAGYSRVWAPIFYEIDAVRVNFENGMVAGRYRHARFMPRWASRLTLTVTDVRVQRLQEINEADAVAEGVTRCAWAEAMAEDGRKEWHVPENTPGEYPGLTNAHPSPVGAFWELWNSLHGPEAWDANPWVAAATFTVQHGNIDQTGGGS